jgi:hypothetical protein
MLLVPIVLKWWGAFWIEVLTWKHERIMVIPHFMMLGVSFNRVEMVGCLLDRGADLETRDIFE